MTIPGKHSPKTSPFLERMMDSRHNRVDIRGMLSLATMFVSMAALSMAILGAGRLISDIFDDGLSISLKEIHVKIFVLALSFFFSWVIGLVSIRSFGNLVYPLIIKIYTWVCLGAVCIIYIKVIQKLYMQKYDGLHFWAYLLILLGGLFVLICLHLLIENHDLRPFSIPLLIVSALQLFVIVFRYVFNANPRGLMLFADFMVFIVMISISALMLMHIGILSPLRDQIGIIFPRTS